MISSDSESTFEHVISKSIRRASSGETSAFENAWTTYVSECRRKAESLKDIFRRGCYYSEAPPDL